VEFQGDSMQEKGYIKFDIKWIESEALPESDIKELTRWRKRLYDLKLIGAYENGIGYGNISSRIGNSQQFIISGSNTGHLAALDGRHFARVIEYNIQGNSLTCRGPVKASSESLTHAAAYLADPAIKAVIHIHCLNLWQELIDKVPTTPGNAEYGTPEMAEEIMKILHKTAGGKQGLIVMGGHESGIITYGETLDEAGNILIRNWEGI
jgi:L-ribulose-5-phosphate 4-epimerase